MTRSACRSSFTIFRPGRSSTSPSTPCSRLYELKNIAGVKDATASLARTAQQREALGPDFIQLSGEDLTAVAVMSLGGHGCISVTSNVAPKICADMQEACLDNDFARALKLNDRLSPLHQALFIEPNPAGPKYALAALGKITEELRAADAEGEREGASADSQPPLFTPGLSSMREAIQSRCETQRPESAAKKESLFKIAAENRRARYNYEIGEVFEAGLMLTGTEVKSLRTGKATIAESYASVDRSGQLFLLNANIPEYLQANRFNHEPKRPRKLLLHLREIAKLAQGTEREGMTIVPLKIYFNDKGRAKIEIALARGKQLHDKRETEKKRDWSREKSRLMREKG